MNVEVKRRWAGEEVDLRPPAASFVEALSELMDGDDRVLALASDEAYRIGLSELEGEFADRVLNGGAAEQNMVGMAAGMAAMGKIPVMIMSGLSATALAGRSMLLSVAHSGLHIVVAGFPGGLAGCLGAAGHALNDLSVFGALPGCRIMVPADAEECAKALITIVDEPGLGYLRLPDEPRPVITGPDSPFDFGRASTLRDGQQLTILATGAMVYESLVAADLLEDQGIDARVLDVHTLQPVDAEAITLAAQETGALVVAEEHAPCGGLGARVAQVAGGSNPVPIEHVHAGGEFAPAGTLPELRLALGLNAAAVVEAAQRVVQRKG